MIVICLQCLENLHLYACVELYTIGHGGDESLHFAFKLPWILLALKEYSAQEPVEIQMRGH